MDISPDNTTTQPISDDQDLAKALAGVLPDDPNADKTASGMEFEETATSSSLPPSPAPSLPPTPVSTVAPTDDTVALLPPFPDTAPESAPSVPEPNQSSNTPSNTPSSSPELEGIKIDALNELRPLIDHVDLPPEEKFDTYLMLIRITDDASLIAPAHTAAQNISDEKRKAEALLDIIKEIDYLSKKDQQQ